MALTLTEALIRNRVNLTHENLEDIKALSLPGTYHEKIVSIGTSLRKFSRLKSLDFSRNALESLQGLEHLQLLEKLNLYYNNVSSLDELKRLKHNPNLKEIDLRLNPVTRNEPDYRLYLIHMLPNLQKLDDRGVRDRERQAALTHFSSSQAVEMVAAPTQTQTATKSPNPRAEMVTKLKKGPSILVDDDDIAVIDAVNRNQGDLGRPRPLTGSVAKEDKVEDYSLDELYNGLEIGQATSMRSRGLKVLDQPKAVKYRDKSIEEARAITKSTNTDLPSTSEYDDPRLAHYKEKYPNIMSVPGDGVQKIGDAHRKDPNLLFPDQVEASSKYRGQGYFTPHPQGDGEAHKGSLDYRENYDPLSASDPFPRADGDTAASRRPLRQDAQPRISQDDSMLVGKPIRRHRTNSATGREGGQPLEYDEAKEKTFIYSLLNLVDRYWNGSKSLHKHQKFIEQALKYLSEFTLTRENNKDEEIKLLRSRVEMLQEENEVLRERRGNVTGEPSTSETEVRDLKSALRKAHDDIKRMHDEIRHYISENRSLQKRLDGVDYSYNAYPSKHHSAAAASDDFTSLDELQRQNNALSQELDIMRAKVKQYSQLQELASMLQESHKSLVSTNDHLLRELNETKEKHHREVEQMHWSYDQLKSTLGYSSVLRASNHSMSSVNDHTVSKHRDNQREDGQGV